MFFNGSVIFLCDDDGIEKKMMWNYLKVINNDYVIISYICLFNLNWIYDYV